MCDGGAHQHRHPPPLSRWGRVGWTAPKQPERAAPTHIALIGSNTDADDAELMMMMMAMGMVVAGTASPNAATMFAFYSASLLFSLFIFFLLPLSLNCTSPSRGSPSLAATARDR